MEQTRVAHGLTEIAAIGNSMGGFMALRLAELTEVHRVAAFAPQFSMHPNLVPQEIRWARYAKSINDWPYPDVGALTSDETAYFIFHGYNPMEAWHWLRFPWSPRINHFIFKGPGHNVAARLQSQRLLGQIFNAAMSNRPRAVRHALERSRVGRRFEVMRREQYQAAYPELTLGAMGAAAAVPERVSHRELQRA